jgi:hypothetical protein
MKEVGVALPWQSASLLAEKSHEANRVEMEARMIHARAVAFNAN